MPCEAENPNVPVVLGLAYDPDLHTCDWPDLLTHRGCDPAERLGDFLCPSLTGQQIYSGLTEFFLPGFGILGKEILFCGLTAERNNHCVLYLS